MKVQSSYLIPVYCERGYIARFDSYSVVSVSPDTKLGLPVAVLVSAWTPRNWNDAVKMPFGNWLQHHLNPHPYMSARQGSSARNTTCPSVSRVVWTDGSTSWAKWESRKWGNEIRLTISGPCHNPYFTVTLRKAA